MYFVDLVTLDIFRVDDDTSLLTEEDMAQYPHLIDQADHKELKAFIVHKVFKPTLRENLGSGANLVDCVWIRKWAIKYQLVKSRMCARGCFDKQTYLIDRLQHSRHEPNFSPR